ncbi:MAG: hypothetical protein ABI383_13465 [Acidobacteriaceae bacterium]
MPERATLNPKARNLAQWLITQEAVGSAPETNVPALVRVAEKLRRPLSTLAGDAGFSSLLARALVLAKKESPSQSAEQVKPDGSPLSELRNHMRPEEGVALIAHLLELLFTFIGEGLTLRLLHDVWPDLSLDRDQGHPSSAKEMNP